MHSGFAPYNFRPDAINTEEGVISQSNSKGERLFYGGAGANPNVSAPYSFHVFNKVHQRMLNSPITGDPSSVQGGLPVPMPGDGSKFYLFTVVSYTQSPYASGLRYSIVDTTLDGGKGGIVSTQKNIAVKALSGSLGNIFDTAVVCTESITAIPKCNGTDYWICIIDNSPNGSYANSDKLLIYSLTSLGISFHGISSMVVNRDPRGALKASPDGNWLGNGAIIPFDRNSGTVQAPKQIGQIMPICHSFSPGSKFYYGVEKDQQAGAYFLYQYNLLSGNLLASRKKVAAVVGYNSKAHMQIGPDGKIYIARFGERFLSVINYPDSECTPSNPNACGYQSHGPDLSVGIIGGTSQCGLPNCIDAKRVSELPVNDFIHIDSNCTKVSFKSLNCCVSQYYWNFGNGVTSVSKDTTIVLGKGIYTVKHLAGTGTDTVVKTVRIGFTQPTLAGDTLICDTSLYTNYSVNIENNFGYEWRINGGTVFDLNAPANIDVKWNATGDIKLVVTNLLTGCKDSTTKNIVFSPPIESNHIDSSQVICNQALTTLIGGKATGGTGGITYQWWKQSIDSNWQIIPGARDTFYLPTSLEDSVLYMRVAKSDKCESASNALIIKTTVRNNKITMNTRACIAKDSFTVNGTLPTHANDSVFTYSWEYSLDSVSWDSISNQHSQNLKWSYPADSIYVRRKVIVSPSSCSRYSNILKVHPLIYFIKQPRSKPVCRYHPGEYVAFDSEVRLHKDTAVALHYFWQVKGSNDSSPWNDTTTYNPATDTSYRYFHHSFAGAYEDSVRCIVFTPCGKIYSTIAIMYIIIDTIDYEFVIPPTSVTVSEGGSAYFTTYLNSDHGFEYFWQESKDGGETWQTIPGETDIDITINNVTRCMNKIKYRLAVFNGCYNWYSDPATLTVTFSYVNSLMMRDATDDTGTEPYPNNNIWASPDIWFSRNSAATYDYNNNNIEYKKLTPIGYAKVQVKNTGSTTSPAQKVVVHWTVASTLELWPKHWLSTSDNIIINNVPSSPFYQDTFYRGGVIDTVTIGPMTAGSTQVIVLPWEVPNPAWYGVNGLDSSLMVCLLGRILTCDEKPYGMTFPEGLVTATNARNNRKIITRNFHVVDTASGDMQGKPGGGNYWAQNMNAAYNLKAVSCDYFDYGVVDIVMDDVLSNAWYANGAHGSGFTVIDDHTIRITDTCDVWLTDVAFGPNEETQVKIHFVTDESYERATPMSFDFEWYQYNQDSLALDTPLADGGMMLRCDLPDNVAAHYLDNQILITSSGLPYKHSICNGAMPPPLIGSNPVTPAYWTYQWQSTTDTMGVWTDIPGATDRDYNPSINNMNMFYRRGALKQHALALNYSPIFFMRLRDPMILTSPANASVDEGDIATFVVSYQDMEVVNWTRTHFSIGVIIDETSDTLNFQTQECYNGNTFQAVLRDVCTSIETSTSSATLTVNPVSDNLYAQDNTSGSFIWSSPDMVNRRDNDNGSTHQTPEFGNPNYIYTTVRNNGIDASAPAKLYLYWSVATTGGAWERNWKFDTTESAETGNWIMHQGAKTPLGGLIGVYDIPSIASSSYYRGETEWNPIDPAVYGLENTTLSDIILLGRIVTCEDEPYGMNPPEVNDLAYNVRYNERIISKHKIVTDVIPGNDVIHKAGNGNINDISMDGRLVFKALDCDYFQYGYVLLHTDATLQSIWTNSDGSGYTIVDDSTLQVDSCQNALLWDIGYGANQRTWLGVEFVTWDTLTVDTTENYYFEFDLEQYMNGDNDTSVGGIRYGVPIHLEPPAPESLIKKENPKERTTFTAFPNPFRDELNISYKLPQEANVTITVFNMLGQQVRVLEQGNLKTAGTHRLLLNSSFLKEGIYFINFTAGSFTQTQKVVLIR
ncbi:MAG: T9SS type A sorting domain-containing protein [Bacteroidia bacterium]|nr:T9SS type A sorting domain-containing protein [Bacteroidia bacterium]